MGQRKATTPINMYQANPRDMHSTTETMSGNISTRGFGAQRHAHGGPVHMDMRISLSPTARRRLAGDQHPIISWAIGFVTLVHRKD